jgi:hypothetical protein
MREMAERALGWYVYCVVRADEAPAIETPAGVDPEFPVEAIAQDGLAAVASRVRLDEFGSEALRRNLENLRWVERVARAHHDVLEAALVADSVVPLRLCTIFSEEEGVRRMLEGEHEALLEAIDRVRGHTEWGLKVLADPRQLEAAIGEQGAGGRETAANESPGRAFFARKKLARAAQDEANARAQAVAQDAHDRLRREAAAATLLPPQHPELSKRSGQMVLNGAYLVHRSRVEQFIAVAGELREQHRGEGVEFDLSGPWPPYNFAVATGAQS